MVAESERAEYLEAIRQQVCSRCIERPSGGPPCAPLGKVCGVEMHLGELVDAIHQVHSGLIEPYLENNRHVICEKCPHLHSSICPCPMDYLLVLVVQAVETVDRRHEKQKEARRATARLPESASPGLQEVHRAFEEAVGTWAGCDWPTVFGDHALDLNGWSAEEARDAAVENAWGAEAEDWEAAARWLAQVEEHAALAEKEAARAVEAADAGRWPEATELASRAWSREFATGRLMRRGSPATWQRLHDAIEAARAAASPVGSEAYHLETVAP